MKDAAFFIHHFPLSEPLTKKHITLLRHLNPNTEVIPLKFPDGYKNAKWQTWNCDYLVYEWFKNNSPKHERFFIFEYDCFCSQSIAEFYGKAYDYHVAGANIVRPWSRSLISGREMEPTQERDWRWFKDNEHEEFYPFMRGIFPICGTVLSHEALFNIVELWSIHREKMEGWLSEARLGTLACMAGYEPKQIRPDCGKFLHSGNIEIGDSPGIYHCVKS